MMFGQLMNELWNPNERRKYMKFIFSTLQDQPSTNNFEDSQLRWIQPLLGVVYFFFSHLYSLIY